MTCDFWADFAKTLIGTFVGAGLAFGFNLYVQHLQRRAAQLVAGNVAMVTLSQQLGDFRTARRGLREEMEEKDRTTLPLWLRVRPISTIFDEQLKFDFEGLGFIVRPGPPLLGDLAHAQRLYLKLAYLVREHTETGKKIQERLSAQGINESDISADSPGVRDSVGRDLAQQQIDVTDSIREHCEKDEQVYLELAGKLHSTLREIFGFKHFGRPVAIVAIAPENPPDHAEQETPR